MKNSDRTTYIAPNGTFPRREQAESAADPLESSSSGTIDTGNHTFPPVPKLRRRLIPRIPTPYRESASQGPREDASIDTLPRVVSARTHGFPADRRRRALVMLAVGMVLGLCTALFRLTRMS